MGGGGNTYDYGFRIYNPSLGRFLSVDPLTESYPFYTPYQFAANRPLVNIDLDGLEGIDHRILEHVKNNISEYNINMQNAPLKGTYKGEKTRVNGGRKWNARWAFDQMDQLYPDFWSDKNKQLLANGELPVVDEQYLQKIGKGLSVEDFKTLRSECKLGSVIRHHHMNHGNFVVALEKQIHGGAGNYKFWHNTSFRNHASKLLKTAIKTGAKVVYFTGLAITLVDLAHGQPAQALGLPEPEFIGDVSIELLQKGMQENNFDKTKIGLHMLENSDFSVSYWTADDYLNYINGKNVDNTNGTKIVDEQVAKEYPYLNIMYKGETIGVVDIPDKVK